MRVLFTTWAWPSHYFPMVPLAWALHTAGHEVRMASQPELAPTMQSSGLPCTSIGPDFDVAAVFRRERDEAASVAKAGGAPAAGGRHRPDADRICDDMLGDLDGAVRRHDPTTVRLLDDEARSTLRTLWAARAMARSSRLAVYGGVAEAMVDDLFALARSWRPDLIVYDAMTFAGPLVAKLVGVPALRSLFGPDVTYFVRADADAGLTPLLDRFGLDDLDLKGAASLDPCPASLQLPDAAVPTRRIRTRYLPYSGLAEVPGWLLEPPTRPGRERICLTWGTSTDRLHGEQAFLPGDILQGCAKLADERDAELVLAITANQRRLIPDPPPDVRIVVSVPLDALLSTCDALIHQGGAGTMLTALHHGLPQLVLPQLVDQAANACRLVAAGAGRTRCALDLAASDLIAAGHDLLDNPAYRSAAGDLQNEMRRQPTPADVVAELAALAR
jgi:UDP:flavonoid glycosyltransferase YjiC (YdhE family)